LLESSGQDADAARAGAAGENPRKSSDENQGLGWDSAGRTLSGADGCVAAGALAVSAARTCFGAVAAGAAEVELCGAGTGLTAEADVAPGVAAGCAAPEGMGMEALLSREFGADGSFAVEAPG